MFTIHADLSGLFTKLERSIVTTKRLRQAILIRYWRFLRRETVATFDALAHSGQGGGSQKTFRGKSWPWFKDQYTRKDGTVIPAEGGVPKMYSSGVVKGRKRMSGKRITSRSHLMDDVEDRGLKSAAGSYGDLIEGGHTISVRTKNIGHPLIPEQYKEGQSIWARPFFFQAPEDYLKFRQEVRVVYKKFREAVETGTLDEIYEMPNRMP